MYLEHFGLIEPPFSIVPNSRYLFLSERHREALQHLKMGLANGGGFAMLTGEVGTGKTTVSKAMMATFDSNVKIGLILNPTFSSIELLEAICDQFKLHYPKSTTLKSLATTIQDFLYENHHSGFQTLLFIDEAQHLSAEVLEQLRLLTNIETDDSKLLKVLLIGQPELQKNLQRTELRQLAQRITGRYHLLPLVKSEVGDYVQFRLQLAQGAAQLFSSAAVKCIAESTHGVPRLINLVCDKCLQLAYLAGEQTITANIAKKAITDVMAFQAPSTQVPVAANNRSNKRVVYVGASLAAIVMLGLTTQPHFSQWLPAKEQSAQSVVYSPDIHEQSSVEKPLPEPQNHLKQETLIDVQDELPPWVIDTVLQSKHYYDSMRTLFAVWGYDASIIQSQCSTYTPSPFFCDTLQGNIAEVIAYNRPVVLTLNIVDQPFYGVLYRVFDDQMEMLFGNSKLLLPIEWLDKHWDGQYRTLWFSEVNGTLKMGDSGEAVRKLDLLLSQVLSDSANDNEQFDERLEARVKAFQSWQGLYVDGIAGKKTLQTLGQLANSSAPKLIFSSPEQEGYSKTQAFQKLTYPKFENLSPLNDAVTEQAIASSSEELISDEADKAIAVFPEEHEAKDEPLVAQSLVTAETPPVFDFDQLDLSELAPELASRVQSALELPQGSLERESMDIEIYEIEALPRSISALLPDMNFQSHMYASQEDKRWIKVNGREFQEGELLAENVVVETIEPRRVILDVAGNRVAIPSLYEWHSQ